MNRLSLACLAALTILPLHAREILLQGKGKLT